MTKKTLSSLLALLMLLSAVSCSETPTEQETTPQQTPVSSGTDSTESEAGEEDGTEADAIASRLAISDDLPNVNYNGQDFRILAFQGNDQYNTYVDNLFEVYAEEQTGDSLNDSVYNRNLVVEDRFGVTIQAFPNGVTEQVINTSVQAGTNDYDLVGLLDYMVYVPVGAKSLYNIAVIPNVNLDKPWHNKLANDGATINGRLFADYSDLSLTALTYTFATFFNMTMMEDQGYPSSALYALVKEGEWTIDKLIEITGNIYTDTDGGGTKDDNDVYGYGYFYENEADVWLTAFDQPILSVTEDNSLELTFMTDKTVSILEKLMDWHNNSDGFRHYTGAKYASEEFLLNNKLAMGPIRFYAAFNTLRTMEDPYSVLPYPKWDTAQSGYYTTADDKFSVFGVPTTAASQLEFVGTIYEALCAESYKTVYPKYYDEALKGRYSTEPETAEMVDLIMAGRKFDVAFQFGENYLQNLPYMIRYSLKDNDGNIASRFKKVQKSIKRNIETKLLPPYLDDLGY